MPDPFCIPEQYSRTIFYESKHFRVLYDIKPVVSGHILVVSKRHVLDITELSEEEIKDLHNTFEHVVPKVLSVYGATESSYDLTAQIGAYSGRTVAHLHLHIIPRKKFDEYQSGEKNIFQDLKMNKTHFTIKDVETEVEKLRKEFNFKPMQK